MNEKINTAIRDFKISYKSYFEARIDEVLLNEQNSVDSLESLTDFIKRSKFRGKVFFLFFKF